MDIKFVRSENLKRAAKFTYDNMRGYYEQFAPDWDLLKIYEVTSELDNYDIVYQSEVVGVMRLQFEADCCVLRDLQVLPHAQNNGIGNIAINEAKKRTLNANLYRLKLRVFKASPAVKLYQRNGFDIQNEDERFYNMVVEI